MLFGDAKAFVSEILKELRAPVKGGRHVHRPAGELALACTGGALCTQNGGVGSRRQNLELGVRTRRRR